MKRTLLSLSVIAIAFLLKSCAPTLSHVPLKGKHLEDPYIVVTEKPFDEVWDNVIDILAQRGFPIRFLDKENGLVVSERSSLLDAYTYEDRAGKLENPDALLVLPTVSIWGIAERVHPLSLTGIASIRVRKLKDNTTKINVNLNALNVDVIGTWDKGTPEVFREAQFIVSQEMRSTGLFEYKIAEMVK